MSSMTSQEMRRRALELREQQRAAELQRLAAPASSGDIEAAANRIVSSVSKLISAVDHLRQVQAEILRQLKRSAPHKQL